MEATDHPVRNPFWRREIEQAMHDEGESWDDYVAHFGNDLDVRVTGLKTPCWTLWTRRRVYFPHDYDGHVTVRSAPRDPCDEGCYA